MKIVKTAAARARKQTAAATESKQTVGTVVGAVTVVKTAPAKGKPPAIMQQRGAPDEGIGGGGGSARGAGKRGKRGVQRGGTLHVTWHVRMSLPQRCTERS